MEIREAASKAGLELVLLTTPTTPKERMQAIAKASQGFVYLVSVTGRFSKLLAERILVYLVPMTNRLNALKPPEQSRGLTLDHAVLTCSMRWDWQVSMPSTE